MIPVASTLVHTDEIPGEKIAFTIGDPRWMMKMAAKQYSDVTTAIIREYSTNAYDANVMAGHADPIEVTLPSMMNDYMFIVKDRGPGMDREDFVNIYTRFGISQKRTRNDTNGMLGIGSKSGVAYTDQFTVISVKDGIKTSGIIMREPDWSISLKIIATVKTDEPNGTTIKVPVHDIDEFNHKARDFYKWWLPGRVLVNGTEPEHNVGGKITDSLYYCNDRSWNTSYVVMGNVAYKINNPAALFRNTTMNQINFVAYVDNADVEFVPSREDLEYSGHTKAALQKIVDSFEKEIVALAQADIIKAATHAEAFKSWTHWSDTLGRSMFQDLEFKGDKFVSDFAVHGHMYQPGGGRGRSAYSVRQWNVEAMPRTVVITDYTHSISSRHKEMAREVSRIKGWASTYVLFTHLPQSTFTSPWHTHEQFITWDEVKEIAPKPAPKIRSYSNPNAGRISGSWDYWDKSGYHEQESVPSGKDLYYIYITEAKNFNEQQILRMIPNTDNAVVIMMPMNRLDKFNRENPKAQHFITWARTKVVLDSKTLLCDDGKRVKQVSYTDRNWLRCLDETKVTDPEIARLKSLIKDEDTLFAKYNANRNLANALRMYNVKSYEPNTPDYLSSKYPLLAGSIRTNSSFQHEHIYLYISAAHEAAESEATSA